MSITIGSDPEFGLMFANGEQALAHHYLKESTSAPIGVDGHRHIGELRPTHGETPREHLYHIAVLMETVGQQVPDNIKITAGSMVCGDAIGGHIHFGNLGRNLSSKAAVSALDYYLSLPIALIEVQRSARRRRETGYGGLGAHRNQPWGIEYRTLPSWLMGWGVALSVLSIGYAVVDAVKSNGCPPVPRDIPNPEDFYDCDKTKLRPLLAQIKDGWRALPLYPKMRLEFAFLNHLLSRGMEWREGQDVRHKWWPAKRPKSKHQVLGNPKDHNCPQIALLVKGVKGTKVFIYGLNPDREPDIAINDLDIVSGLNLSYQIQGTMYGVAREYDGWLCIGLSLELRQDAHAAADLINLILRRDRQIAQFHVRGNLYRGAEGRFQSRQQMRETANDEIPSVSPESSGYHGSTAGATTGNIGWTTSGGTTYYTTPF